jgi:GMP synthase (glutamine-hydrolysing)
VVSRESLGGPWVLGSASSFLPAELNVYCEMHSCLVDVSVLRGAPIKGVILSGGPSSVYDPDAPHVQQAILDWVAAEGIPVLGICYGFQELAHRLGGRVEKAPEREFGFAEVRRVPLPAGAGHDDAFLEGLPPSFTAWMSHGDKITAIPPGFGNIGVSGARAACLPAQSARFYASPVFPQTTRSTPS